MKTLPLNSLVNRFFSFRAQEDGNITVLGLFGFIAIAALGSFALDVSNIYAARTHLQTAADQAAHAALYNRQMMGEEDAKAQALSIANATLPSSVYGQIILLEDVEFGWLDADSGEFVVSSGAMNAAQVQTRFTETRGNAVKSYLMQLLGVDQFNIMTEAVYATYKPGCLREGFIAEGVVDIQSNNAFSNGFCLHSNTYVSLSSNNTFAPGTIVSMPNLSDLDLPQSGFDTNEGLATALRKAKMNVRILSRINNITFRHESPLAAYSSYPDPETAADTPAIPDYITNTTPITSRFRTVTPAEIYALGADTGEGRIHLMNCQGGNGLTINASAQPLRNVVIITPCDVKFSAGSALEDVRIITKSSSSDSFNAPSGLRIGKNDNCATGGGVQLITFGGIRFAAGLELYGSQLMAKGDIYFSANAEGVQGASLIAGGEISGTSNMNMGLCMSGMEDNLEINYYRMVR